jgi:hypothetical protein
MIVNAFNPWLSKKSLEKGVNWSTELTTALGKVSAGIICLTPSNLTEPWILFESGAIAKAVKAETDKPRACTLLIGLKSSDVKGPLAQFQNTELTRDDLLRLVQNLNAALGEAALKETQVEKAFNTFWPDLKKKLDNLPPDGPTDRPKRSEQEMIEEILDTVRSASKLDSFHLTQLADAISDISEKLASMALNRSQSFVIRDGRVVPMSSLADAQRLAWDEPPPVPPELLDTQPNQPPVSKPRPAPRRERKLSHTSRKPRGTG